MRLWEVVLIVLVAVNVAVFRQVLHKKHEQLLVWSGLLSVIAAGLQATVEGARWQVGPCYVSLLLMALCALLNRRSKLFADRAPQFLKQFVPFNFLLVGSAVVLSLLLPISPLPAPTGPYPVGTATYHLIDQKRRETFSLDQGCKRELMIQVWYPAASTIGSRRAPFMAPSNDLRPFFGAPIFAVAASYLHLIPTGSWESAPMARDQARFPVLIFSHGLMGGRIQNTVQEQELASHGYVVVGVDHTYDGSFTVVSASENIASGLLVNSLAPQGSAASLLIKGGLSIRVEDVRFVIDELERLDKKDSLGLLTDRLDLQRIGLFGHSFGGATTLLACAVDKRFCAGIAMDATVPDELSAASIKQPFLFMEARRAAEDPLGTQLLCGQLSSPCWSITIDGAEHGDFTDLPMLTPVHRLSLLTGPIDGQRAMQIIDAYSLVFFDQTLRGKHDELLDGPSRKYPEVGFTKKTSSLDTH